MYKGKPGSSDTSENWSRGKERMPCISSEHFRDSCRLINKPVQDIAVERTKRYDISACPFYHCVSLLNRKISWIILLPSNPRVKYFSCQILCHNPPTPLLIAIPTFPPTIPLLPPHRSPGLPQGLSSFPVEIVAVLLSAGRFGTIHTIRLLTMRRPPDL